MNRETLVPHAHPIPRVTHSCRVAALSVLTALAATGMAAAQAITIDTNTGNLKNSPGAPVDRRFAQVEPTHVALPNSELDPKTRIELIRALSSEQGFAMRPLPRGRKGLTLQANGLLAPAGEAYLAMVTTEGLSVKPGDRVVLSDIRIEKGHIVFDLNDGPEGKHRFLRHIQIGGTGEMDPIIRDNGTEPTGARVTLTFANRIPELTGAQIKALLSPLISFDVKTPAQAFTDTLPDKLKEAILNHKVLVGMSTDMLIYSKGQPEMKYHEILGNMPFDEWIYGKTPNDVQFVRINGNRVIRVEIAQMGKKPVVFEDDEVQGLMRTDGSPLMPPDNSAPRTLHEGDVEPSANTPPPTLGEAGTQDHERQVMKPVLFPRQQPDLQPGANPDSVPDDQPPVSLKPAAPATEPASQDPQKKPPVNPQSRP